MQVINNGHTIQVEWLYNYGAEVSIAVPGMEGSGATVFSTSSTGAVLWGTLP